MSSIRILIFCTYLICLFVFPFKDMLLFKTIISHRLWYYLIKIRLFAIWNVFGGMAPFYYDIKIKAISDKNNYEWNWRDTVKVENLILYSSTSRLTLCFFYKRYFAFFLNEYLLKNIKDNLLQKSETLKYFTIEEIWYNSLSDEEIKNTSNLVFEWKNNAYN